jgi:hypothetical protein
VFRRHEREICFAAEPTLRMEETDTPRHERDTAAAAEPSKKKKSLEEADTRYQYSSVALSSCTKNRRNFKWIIRDHNSLCYPQRGLLESPTLKMGEHSWKLQYYPGGLDDPQNIRVQIVNTSQTDLKAGITITIGAGASSYRMEVTTYKFPVGNLCY